MARLERFERSTYGLEGRCSIQLSYRRGMVDSRYRPRVSLGMRDRGIGSSGSHDAGAGARRSVA